MQSIIITRFYGSLKFRKRDNQLKILLPKKKTHYIKVDLHVTDND